MPTYQGLLYLFPKKKKSSVKLLNLAKQMKKYLKDAATYILEGYLMTRIPSERKFLNILTWKYKIYLV